MTRTITRLAALLLVLVLAVTGVCASEWWDPLAVERQVYTYLTGELGLNSAAACGILANVQYESGFQVTIVGDQGTSYGLFQWHNERYTALKTVCAAKGLDYRTVEGQLAYLNYELKSSYSALMSALKNMENSPDGAYRAAYLWCIQFERPADMESKAVTRGNSAKYKYWNRYNSISMVPLDTEVLMEPEEVIQQIQENPTNIPVFRQEMEVEETPSGRRYVAEKPERKGYTPWHSAPVPPEPNAPAGFAVGMLFALLGDGIKRGWALPEPEQIGELPEPDETEERCETPTDKKSCEVTQ